MYSCVQIFQLQKAQVLNPGKFHSVAVGVNDIAYVATHHHHHHHHHHHQHQHHVFLTSVIVGGAFKIRSKQS